MANQVFKRTVHERQRHVATSSAHGSAKATTPLRASAARRLLRVLAALLAAAAAAPPALAQSPNCGVTVPRLSNGSFEAPAIGVNTFSVTPTTNPSVVWRNTAESYVELWSDGFNGVRAYDGNQFAELNANLAGTLYQALITIPGTQMVFSLAHKARAVARAPARGIERRSPKAASTSAGSGAS